MEDVTHSASTNCVVVYQEDGAWIVRVTVDGHSEDNQFSLERSAHTFAEGQRLRLAMLADQRQRSTKKPAG